MSKTALFILLVLFSIQSSFMHINMCKTYIKLQNVKKKIGFLFGVRQFDMQFTHVFAKYIFKVPFRLFKLFFFVLILSFQKVIA